MKVSSERIPDCQVIVNVELEPEEVEKYLQKAYSRLVKKVNIPGFRKGKTPRNILENQIGRQSFLEDAINNDIPTIYSQVIKDNDIDAIDEPRIEVIQLDPIIFKATIPVRPIIELDDYTNIKIAINKSEVTEEQIQNVIQHLQNIHASWEPVDRDSQWNDMLIINVKGINEGKILIEDIDRQYELIPGMEVPIKGFAEELIGIAKGQSKSFTLVFPDNYSSEELAGKDCLFEVSVTEIKAKRLPEVSDEFAKIVGSDTVDILYQRIKEDLVSRNESFDRKQMEENAIQAVVDIAKIEFPPILKERQIERMIDDQRNQLSGANVTLEDYLQYVNKTEDEMKNEMEPIAAKQIKGSLVLGKVAELANITISDEEMEDEIEKITPKDKGEEFRKFLNSDVGRGSLMRSLITRKTIQHLVDIATANGDKDNEVEKEDNQDAA